MSTVSTLTKNWNSPLERRNVLLARCASTSKNTTALPKNSSHFARLAPFLSHFLCTRLQCRDAGQYPRLGERPSTASSYRLACPPLLPWPVLGFPQVVLPKLRSSGTQILLGIFQRLANDYRAIPQ